MELKNLIDIETFHRIAQNLLPTISSVSFSYLYLFNSNRIAFVLGLVSLFNLALFINIQDRILLVIRRKYPNLQTLRPERIGQNVIEFMMNDPVVVASYLVSFLLGAAAFFFLVFNLIDFTTRVLLLLCLFGLFHYVTKFSIDIYVYRRYKKYFLR